MKTLTALFALVSLITAISCHASPDVEKQIVRQIDALLPHSNKLLEQIVNINSGTLNFSGVQKVGAVLQQQFDDMGFQTEWVAGDEFNRAGHLVASYGNTGPKIMMIGHLDTVFAKDDDFQHFTKLDEMHIAGPGITDMKGGDVIIVSTLRALKQLKLLDNVSIRVVMTGDEEASGRPLSKSKKALIDAAKWADVALGFEDGDSNIKTAVVARRGSVNWQLDVTGTPAHSSQIFTEKVGFGAIFETARILDGFRQSLAGVGNLTFNPGLMLGGTTLELGAKSASGNAFGKNNVVAKVTSVKGGIRALSHEELENAKNVMQGIVKQNLAGTTATLTFGDGYPPMAPTKGNYKLLGMYSDVSESLGYGPVVAVNPRNAGAADISFAADYVDMALDGLGLMGEGGHTKDEVADMTTFNKNMHKAAILIYRLSLAN